MSTHTLENCSVREIARQFWADGNIVIQGTFKTGPDRGDTFLVSQDRTDFEDSVARLLEEPTPRSLVVSVQTVLRDIVERGIWQVPAGTQDDFNQDIGVLMALRLVAGADIMPPAGVELAILLDDRAGHPITARGGLAPKLAKRARRARKRRRQFN